MLKISQISPERLELLHTGQAETRDSSELLALDLGLILKNTYPNFRYAKPVEKVGIVQRLKDIAVQMNEQFGFTKFEEFATHKCDVIRFIACSIMTMQPFSFKEKLGLITKLADDNHSILREWAMLSIRPYFVQNLVENIDLIAELTNNSSPNLRRFACELSRPRGVWCKYIPELQKEPWLALKILEPLKSDESRYVQLSVGNWLNDASKSQRDWVIDLCSRWQKESPTPHTQAICKRGMRTIMSEKVN